MATASKRAEPSAKVHTFTLILSGAQAITTELGDKLFEAGCDDALLGQRCGELYLSFDREAESLSDAVVSAIRAVESAQVGLQVVRVEPPDAGEFAYFNWLLESRRNPSHPGADVAKQAWKAVLTSKKSSRSRK